MRIDRLKPFILQEKIKKSNADASINDPKIMIGMEFEYIDNNLINGIGAYKGKKQTFRLRELDSLRDEIYLIMRNAERNYSNAETRWYDDIEDKWRNEYDKVFEIWDKHNDLKSAQEEEIDILNKEIDEILSGVNLEITNAANRGEMTPDLKDYYKDIDMIKKKIVKETKKLKVIEKKFDKIQKEYDKLGEYEDNMYDYGNEVLKIDSFNNSNKGKVIIDGAIDSIPKLLMDFWLDYDYGEATRTTINAGFKELITNNDFDIINTLTNPYDLIRENTILNFEEKANKFLNKKDLPFQYSNAKVGSYDSSGDDVTVWHIEDDGSLDTDAGVEIVSPMMSVKDAIPIMKKMFAYIDKHGYTDTDCGFHMHLSHSDFKGRKFSESCDLLKVLLFVEEGYIFKEFDERVDNQYTASMLNQLDKKFKRTKETDIEHNLVRTDISENSANLRKLFLRFRKTNRFPAADHYNGVNFESWSRYGKNPHIEFRYLGGSNYHKKEKQILKVMGQYAFIIRLGLDPNLRKEEYIKKLYRLYTQNKDPKKVVQTDALQLKADRQQYEVFKKDGIKIGSNVLSGSRRLIGISIEYYWYKKKVYSVLKDNKKNVKITYVDTELKFRMNVKRNNVKNFFPTPSYEVTI